VLIYYRSDADSEVMTNEKMYAKHRLSMPKKHYKDFVVLGIFAAAPWGLWFFLQASWAFTLAVVLTVISLGLMVLQAIGGIIIRNNTSLHFESDPETGITKAWMAKAPDDWKKHLNPLTNQVNLKEVTHVTVKRINGKHVLAVIDEETNQVLNVPHRLAHVVPVNEYLKQALSANKRLSAESIAKAETFLNESEVKNIPA
jgi:hypothetical protein